MPKERLPGVGGLRVYAIKAELLDTTPDEGEAMRGV